MMHSEVHKHIGRRVVYYPRSRPGDGEEYGVIQSMNSKYVFVLYNGDMTAKATLADNLELLPGDEQHVE